MFYVYDIDGLRFKGPLEQLERRRRVERRAAAAAIKEGETEASTGEGPGAQAAATYEQMVKPGNMVEPLVHIYQIMSSPVSTISPDISLVDVWMMLKKGNIRQVVVTTARKEIVGLVAERDILKHINIVNDEVEVDRNLVVKEIIENETITTDSKSDIRSVARVMAFYHIDALPVLEEERLVGIVTRGDILRGFAENPKLNLWA